MKQTWIKHFLIGGLALVAFTGCSQYTGRKMTLFDYENAVALVREEKEVDLYADMPMEAGDRLTTSKGSQARVNIDNKKRVRLDEETSVQIDSKGNKKNNHTEINLQYGTIYNEIDEKLSNKSSYKIHTNNTTISVHGTIFSVSEDGTETIINVFEGEVGIENEKGVVAAITGGNTARVKTDAQGNLDIEQEKMEIETVSQFELEAIKDAPKEKPVVFSEEEINKQLQKYSDTKVEDDEDEVNDNQDDEDEVEDNKGNEDNKDDDKDDEDEDDVKDNNDNQNNKDDEDDDDKVNNNKGNENNKDDDSEDEFNNHKDNKNDEDDDKVNDNKDNESNKDDDDDEDDEDHEDDEDDKVNDKKSNKDNKSDEDVEND